MANESEPVKTYKEKLKDPRWQKMRLKVFERDEWYCARCGDSKSTLHVHHRYYLPNADPWDYPMEALVTLCENCHNDEQELKSEIDGRLLHALRSKFFYQEIADFMVAFEQMDVVHVPYYVSWCNAEALTNRDFQMALVHDHKEFMALVSKLQDLSRNQWKRLVERFDEVIEMISREDGPEPETQPHANHQLTNEQSEPE